MRRHARVDDNQADIVAALRKIGAVVQVLSMVGRGCVDLLVGYHGTNFVIEVKDGSKPACERRLTPDEKKWHDAWSRQVPVYIIESVDQAVALLTNTQLPR